MVKHIVMWRLYDEVEGVGKQEAAARIKSSLEELNGKVPGLVHIEVGLDFDRGEQAADIVLYSELESREALTAYQEHPLHQAIVPMVRKHARERTVVDYDI